MSIEQFANNATTTLNGAITSGATSLVVTSATAFPASPQFRLLIDAEILLVAGVTGATFMVSRGQEGTTAVAHNSLAPVTHVLTSGGLIGVGGTIHTAGSFSTRPVTGTAGRLFFPSDGCVVQRDDGTTWRSWGPSFPLTPPTLQNWAWVNQNGATMSATGDTLVLAAPGAGSGANIHVLKKSAPATGTIITAFFLPVMFFKAFNSMGLCFRESSSGKLAIFDILMTGSNSVLRATKFTNATTFSADYQSVNIPAPMTWLRIVDDGVNRICSVGTDGQNWIQFHSISRTDFLTADEVGIVVGDENSATPNMGVIMNLLHWKEG